MKALFFTSIFLCLNLVEDIQNSNEWVDYVVGKPYMAYFEAKEAVAKEMGVNYRVEFLGCELSKEMDNRLKLQTKKNQLYFNALEKELGAEWRKQFDFAVKKRLPFAEHLDNPVWKDAVLGRPDPSFFEAKKELAKAWGINYQPIFLGCIVDAPGVKAKRKAAEKESKVYLEAIAEHYGADWQDLFYRELRAKIKERNKK